MICTCVVLKNGRLLCQILAGRLRYLFPTPYRYNTKSACTCAVQSQLKVCHCPARTNAADRRPCLLYGTN